MNKQFEKNKKSLFKIISASDFAKSSHEDQAITILKRIMLRGHSAKTSSIEMVP